MKSTRGELGTLTALIRGRQRETGGQQTHTRVTNTVRTGREPSQTLNPPGSPCAGDGAGRAREQTDGAARDTEEVFTRRCWDNRVATGKRQN